MIRGKSIPQRLRDQAEKAKKEEMENAMKLEFVQKTHSDIPTFPYGYDVNVTNPTGPVAPKWVENPSDFTHDGLSSMPTIEELKNMYGQLDQYASSNSPHLLKSSRVREVTEKFSYNGTPVTPVHLDGKRHLYHIIRIRLDGGRFLEYLRQNATGYCVAFRFLDSLDELDSAYWCYFCDLVHFVKDLIGIFKFKRTHYLGRYEFPWKVRFGRDTINNGAKLISQVYEECCTVADDHGAAEGDGDRDAAVDEEDDADNVDDDTVYRNSIRDPATVVAFHFFFALLGECPRSDLYKEKMFATITSVDEENCEPIGLAFDGLARSWNFSCKTALLLSLVIHLVKIAPALKNARPDIYGELKKEFISYSQMSQQRCHDIVIHRKGIQEEFCLTKEKVHKVVEGKTVGCYVYRERAYNRIVDNCLSLILYSELVLGSMLRHKGYTKPLYLEEFVVKNSSLKAMDVETLFFAQYKSFKTEYQEADKKRRSAILLGFLDRAVLFLKRWCYSTLVSPALDLDDVQKWCKMFKFQKQSKTEIDAAKSVMRDWIGAINEKNEAIKDVEKRIDLGAALKALVYFIKENCPQVGDNID